LRFDDSLKMYF